MNPSGHSSIAKMLQNFSIELVPGDPKLIDAAVERLQPGTVVSLTWIPGTNPMNMIVPAARLRHAGLLVMPHLGARHLESKAHLETLVERLVGEAHVDRVLLIGGERATPIGPFDSSLSVMETDVLQRFGVMNVAIAGFPEGNPHISGKTLSTALAAKVAFARSNDLRLSIMTQFCFSAEPIIAWLRSVRAAGIDVPVRIGLAGPAGLVTLLRYAVKCGIGNSLHVLTENPVFAKTLTDRGPDPIIREIAASIKDEKASGLGIEGLHLYVFGGLNKTLDWIDGTLSRRPDAHS
jgi:methylenetetrahydrofolate reductase (NADPH)